LKPQVLLLRLRDVEGLVKHSCLATAPIIYHAVAGEKHLYFCYDARGGALIICYVVSDKAVKGKYLAYNTFEDRVFPADETSTDARIKYIPVIEVEYQNLIPEEMVE